MTGRQRSKVITAGHTTMIEGLAKFLPVIEAWDEIETIRVGHITNAGRSSKIHHSAYLVRGKEWVKGTGGGFRFRVTRWAKKGSIITGIRCYANNGKSSQEVYLTSKDYRALRARLVSAGYLED